MSTTTTTAASPLGQELDLALLAKALAHPARVRIVQLLLAKDACCGEIVDELPLAQATVSQHLKMLKEAGLVIGEIEGPRVSYCVNRERLEALHALLGGLLEKAKEVDTSGCD